MDPQTDITLVGAYTLIGASVTGMAITMTARNDPDASAGTLIGSMLMTALLTAVTGRPAPARTTSRHPHRHCPGHPWSSRTSEADRIHERVSAG